MSQPMPVRCPAIEHPDIPPADAALLDPLVRRLAVERPVGADEVFPLGTLRGDGRVDLCKQGLRPAGAARVMPALAASPHATHVLLGTNSLGDEGACSVAGALRRGGHGLRTVYLGCNRIGAEGAAALAGALGEDGTVRALWLKRNPLGDAGVRALLPMLARNTALRTLDLVNSGLTAAGLEALLDVLRFREQPLERLFLGGNGLGTESAPLLAALIRDAGVRELYLLYQPPRRRGGRRARRRRRPGAPGAARPRRQRDRARGSVRAGRRARRDRGPRPRPPAVRARPGGYGQRDR